MGFSFLHAADLHLGSPLLGLALKDEAIARRFAEASRRAFTSLVTQAINERVAFVLIAGDIYDGEWRDTSIGLFFARELARLHRELIPVYIIKGNHDAESVVTSAITLPEAVTVFSTRKTETRLLEDLRVAIHGRSFPTREVADNWALAYPEAKPGWFNIGLLHTSCDGRPGHASYAPCTLADMAARGYDYWALGHVHEFEIVSSDPYVVYPGNLQGRSVRECGPKGAVIVDVEDGRVTNLRRIVTDQARWAVLAVDAQPHETEAALLGALEVAFRSVADAAEGRLVAARVRLTGETALHRRLVADQARFADEVLAAAQRCAEDIWLEKLSLETREPAFATGDALAGVDLAALLAGGDTETIIARFAEDLELVRSKSSGAKLPFTDEDAPALIAQARALLLGRAGGAC
jgi:DNA repair exonuclease SbcCD nuclease subunit